MKAAEALATYVGVKPACDALRVARATFYRRRRPSTGHQDPRRLRLQLPALDQARADRLVSTSSASWSVRRTSQSGRRVYYGALADLITSLEEAKTTGQLGRRLKILTYPSLLVIDEIGYLPVSQTGAMLFFQLINRRYERASTVLTSNKGFEEWGQILGDEVMAAALIDRLLHHCHIVNIRGSSYRMRKHTDLSKILHSPPAQSSPSPPNRKRARAKEENDELEARHLRQVCNFRWPHGVNP